MKKILKWAAAWIVVCNIGLMGLNMLLLSSRSATAAPAGQVETQTLETQTIETQATETQVAEVQVAEVQVAEAQTIEAQATEIQTALESRIAILEQQIQVLDERVRRLEILLGTVAIEDSSEIPISNVPAPAASPTDSSNQLISNVPVQPAATAPQGPQPFTAYRSNVRWGPGTSYPIAIELGQNEPLEIIGYNNDSGKIWFRLTSGPWIADFLVRNAPGALPYISAPTQAEIDDLQRRSLQPSNEPIDATSDPPTLPSPGQSEISGSDSSSVPVETVPVETVPVETVPVETVPVETVPVEPTSIEPAPRLPGATTSSATSSATSIVASSTEAAASDTTLSDTGNGSAAMATAEVTTEFNNLSESAVDDGSEIFVENVTDQTTEVSEDSGSSDAFVVEPTPIALNTLPLIRRPTRTALNCVGGCIEYPAWCDPPIKGHLTFGADQPIYYIPSHPEYSEIPVDVDYGERWFCTAAEAEAAGWRAP